MGLAQGTVAFDYTVTTTFGKGLTLWGAVEAVSGDSLALWSLVVTVFNQAFFFEAIATVFGDSLALWGFIVAIFNQAFFFKTVAAVFSQGLALWRAVGTIGRYGLAEHRVARFDLRSCLIGSGQSESSAG